MTILLFLTKKSQVDLEVSKVNLENIQNNILIELQQNYESLKTTERNVPLQERI